MQYIFAGCSLPCLDIIFLGLILPLSALFGLPWLCVSVLTLCCLFLICVVSLGCMGSVWSVLFGFFLASYINSFTLPNKYFLSKRFYCKTSVLTVLYLSWLYGVPYSCIRSLFAVCGLTLLEVISLGCMKSVLAVCGLSGLHLVSLYCMWSVLALRGLYVVFLGCV